MDDFTNRVYGQSRALSILSKFYEAQRVPQALIFHGEEGTGKFKSALEFAKLINSTSPQFIQKQIGKHTEPYFKHVFPLPRGKGESSEDNPTEKLPESVITELHGEVSKKIINPYHSITIDKANDVKISSIREIKKFISLDYSDIQYRVIVISEAHLMNESAQNALLKSLEEPPPGIVFILLTHKLDKILPTIQSRCWKVRFEPLHNEDISIILQQYFEIPEELADSVSKFSDGSVNKALNLLDNNFKELAESTITILRYAMAGKYHTALKEWQAFIEEKNKNISIHLISMMSKWLNDVIKHRWNAGSFYFEEHIDTIEKFNKGFPDVNVGKALDKINLLYSYIDKNVTLNIIALNVIFELNSIVKR